MHRVFCRVLCFYETMSQKQTNAGRLMIILATGMIAIAVGLSVMLLTTRRGIMTMGGPTTAYPPGRMMEQGSSLPPHGFMGIELGRTSHPAGAPIKRVTPDSGADHAGIRPSDVITAVEGQPVRDVYEVLAITRTKLPGQTVRVTILRDTETLKFDVNLVDWVDMQMLQQTRPPDDAEPSIPIDEAP